MFFLDELIAEGVTFTSPTTMTLNGAASPTNAPSNFYRRFRDAKRPDGTPVQSGDTTMVAVAQSPAGRALTVATLTLGATDTLTLSTATNDIRQSTAGASLPSFSSAGAIGIAYIATSIDLFSVYDNNGGLLNPDRFRDGLMPDDLAAILAQGTITDGEKVFAAAAENGGGLTLAQLRAKRTGGVFMQDNAASGANDGVDTFTASGAGSGRLKRVGIKVAPTERAIALLAGGVVDIVTPAAGQVFVVDAFDEASPATHLSGRLVGLAGGADVDILDIDQTATLEFAASGATVRLRNNSGSSGTFAYTLERIA